MDTETVKDKIGFSQTINHSLMVVCGLNLIFNLINTKAWDERPLTHGATTLAFAYTLRKSLQSARADNKLLRANRPPVQADHHARRASAAWNGSMYFATRTADNFLAGDALAGGIYAAMTAGSLIYTYKQQQQEKALRPTQANNV